MIFSGSEVMGGTRESLQTHRPYHKTSRLQRVSKHTQSAAMDHIPPVDQPLFQSSSLNAFFILGLVIISPGVKLQHQHPQVWLPLLPIPSVTLWWCWWRVSWQWQLCWSPIFFYDQQRAQTPGHPLHWQGMIYCLYHHIKESVLETSREHFSGSQTVG